MIVVIVYILPRKGKGKELKVPYHTSVTATRGGNLPYVMALYRIWRQFTLFPTLATLLFIVTIYKYL